MRTAELLVALPFACAASTGASLRITGSRGTAATTAATVAAPRTKRLRLISGWLFTLRDSMAPAGIDFSFLTSSSLIVFCLVGNGQRRLIDSAVVTVSGFGPYLGCAFSITQ